MSLNINLKLQQRITYLISDEKLFLQAGLKPETYDTQVPYQVPLYFVTHT